jgi:hypothetical protein
MYTHKKQKLGNMYQSDNNDLVAATFTAIMQLSENYTHAPHTY